MYNKIDQETRSSNIGDAFLSKEEVDALVENFRITIENLQIEGEELEPKIEEGKQKISQLKTQKEQLDKEMNEYKHKIEYYQPQIEELLNNQKGYYQKNLKINSIYQKYKIGENTPVDKNHLTFEKAIKSEPLIMIDEKKKEKEKFNFELEKEYQSIDKILKSADNKLTQQEKDTLSTAMQMFVHESEQQVKNERKLEKLFSESLNNREQVLRKEAKLLVIQYCVHCKQRFSPLCNEEGSCVFHIGKLKFYSCKTCGCDEYYNCCGKCLKCSKGCASGKHAAKEKVFRNEITPQSKPKTMSMTNINDSDFYQITFESLQFLPKKQ